MACHIVKQAKLDQLTSVFGSISGPTWLDIEDQSIETRISQAKAKELLVEWKKILIEYENSGKSLTSLFGGSSMTDGLMGNVSSELEGLKDKLFIATGEDQLDTWEAFNHYNLNTQLSDQDRKNLGRI